MKETLQFNFPNIAVEWQGVNFDVVGWDGDIEGGWKGETWGQAYTTGLGFTSYYSKKMDIRALTIKNEKVVHPFFADVDSMTMPVTNTGTAGNLGHINEWHIISRVPLYEASIQSLVTDVSTMVGNIPLGFMGSEETINDVIFVDHKRWLPATGPSVSSTQYLPAFHEQCGSFAEVASTFLYYYRVINWEFDGTPVDQIIVMPPTVMKLSLQADRESAIPYLAARALSSKVDPTMDVV